MRQEPHEMSLNQEPEEMSKDKADPLAIETGYVDPGSHRSSGFLLGIVISFEHLVKTEKLSYRIRCLFFFKK